MQLTAELVLLQTIRFEKVSVSLTENGMYFIHIESDVEVTLSVVKQILKAMQDLQSVKKLPTIIMVDNFSLPSKETREFLAPKEASPFASAEAYVIKSTAQKLVGNFYLNVNKPERPTKMFTDLLKAIDWLEDFR
jgi:hypothetical protein